MMDESRGRSQTTKGVWLAKSPKDNAYGPTLVMDLEGTDGRERGEDDTKFEKQSSLFAMATADTLLVNIWCHDIGRENASGKPLLKTIFQVILKIFNPKKTTLLFVIRDKTSKTPMDALVRDMRTDLQSIWQSVTKPSKHARASFDDFFTLEFTSLPHYEYAHDQFIEEANALYGRFADPNRRDTLCPVADGSNVPANGLVVSLRETWNAVIGDKDLDLPAHKVMVATVRCEEIAAAKLAAMCEGRELASLMSSVAPDGAVAAPGLGLKLAAHAIIALRGYDEEAQYFDESVRVAKRDELRARLVHALKPIAHAHLKRVGEKLLRRLRNAMAASKDSFAFVSAGATKEAREEWANAVADAVPDDDSLLLPGQTLDDESDVGVESRGRIGRRHVARRRQSRHRRLREAPRRVRRGRAQDPRGRRHARVRANDGTRGGIPGHRAHRGPPGGFVGAARRRARHLHPSPLRGAARRAEGLRARRRREDRGR